VDREEGVISRESDRTTSLACKPVPYFLLIGFGSPSRMMEEDSSEDVTLREDELLELYFEESTRHVQRTRAISRSKALVPGWEIMTNQPAGGSFPSVRRHTRVHPALMENSCESSSFFLDSSLTYYIPQRMILNGWLWSTASCALYRRECSQTSLGLQVHSRRRC